MKRILPLLLALVLMISSCQFSPQDFQERPLEIIRMQISEGIRLAFSDRILTRLNGQPLELEALQIDGRTLLPIRPMLEACGAEVSWDGQTFEAHLYDNHLSLQAGSPNITVNGSLIPLELPVLLDGDRLVGPVRPICEALSIGVSWSQDLRILDLSAPLPQDRIALELNGRSVALGDSLLSVQTRWGQPGRIDPSVYDFNWHIYNQDYRNFIMVGYRKDQVCAIYSNAGGFSVLGHHWGDPTPPDSPQAHYYGDELAGGVLHAVLLGEGFSPVRTTIPEYNWDLMEAQERESMDLANAFRVAKGIAPMSWGELLQESARAHSQDMADRNYFSHTNPEGQEPWDRYRSLGGVYMKFGENIYAGHFTAFDTHNGWINSEGHRQAILDPFFQKMGVGMGYNPNTEYKYYMTQHFLL